MAVIQRLTDSCLIVTTDAGRTLFDPGFFTFESGEIDLETIGDIQRVLITHEHADHVNPEFVRWLVDRGDDVVVHGNQNVAELLRPHGIDVVSTAPAGVSFEDVDHERLPNGSTVPNRAFTIDGVFTHPGDSYGPAESAPVLGLAFLAPWGSATASVEFASRLKPQQVVPVHDFYTSRDGRHRVYGIVGGALAAHGIELIPLDWGESASV